MDENRLFVERGRDQLYGRMEHENAATSHTVDIVSHSPYSNTISIRVQLDHDGPQWKATMPWAEFAEMLHRALTKHPKAERME